MNPLPTSPDLMEKPELLQRYFKDMKRWGFNVAYNAFYAFPLSLLRSRYRPIYQNFARQAQQEGYPVCVQIQSTVADEEDLSLSESQYYITNTCLTYKHHPFFGNRNFFASFASDVWLEFLKKLTSEFYEYGYRWVVYEEPMFRVDIPGTQDRFYERFRQRFPHLTYPSRHEESEAYCQVQILKQEILLEFLAKLSRHAKEIGFEKVGVMPWFFTPTHENTPEETWHTACDLGRIHHLQDIDFIIVRMQPDNVYARAMTEEGGLALPWLGYLENQAHHGGKPIIAVNNPTNEHQPQGVIGDFLMPQEYFSRYTLSAAAAAPHGMTRHWYGKNYGEDKQAMALYKQVNPLLNRLGSAISSIALVYSYRGMVHALPRSAKQNWTAYERLAHALLYDAKTPVLTLYADCLLEGLRNAPEVSTLVLFEEYPISPAEIEGLKDWLTSDKNRRLVLFARGRGFTYEPRHFFYNYTDTPSEMVELFGLDPNQPLRPAGFSEWASIRFTGNRRKDAFLGSQFDWRCYGWGAGTFKKSKDLEVLYQETESRSPVITRLNYPGGGQAYFIAQGLDGAQPNFPFAEFLQCITPSAITPEVRVECSPDVLWNRTRNGYLIIANTAPSPGWYRLEGEKTLLWNVQQEKLERVKASRQKLSASEIRLYRILTDEESILDVEGQIYLTSLQSKANRGVVSGYFRRETVVRTLKRPTRVAWFDEDHPSRITQKNGFYSILLKRNEPSEGVWTFEF